MVFPVKYRKALLDNEVVEIIKETAIGIEERYEIEIEAMGMDKRSYSCTLRRASEVITGANSEAIQENNGESDI